MLRTKPLNRHGHGEMLCLLYSEEIMKKLTHEEAHKRQNAMREYYAEGHTAKEVALRFDTSKDYAQKICRGIRSGNQYTNGLFDREANIIKCITERAPNFEYAGEFTGVDGFVNLKCKTCGTVIRKSCVSVRHGHATCEVCVRRASAERRAERKRLKQLQQQEEREQQKYDRLLSKKAIQSTFRICPICNNIFTGYNTYCSPKCQENNKWRMKDGYRRMFPLSEVYERDNGICYLCGKACDWNDYKEQDGVIVYGNMYPSRDHIIPKSKGGKNTWSNIRLAHRICNSQKADSPLVKKMA